MGMQQDYKRGSTYQLVIQGALPQCWEDMFGPSLISEQRDVGGRITSSLRWRVADNAALHGVLSWLLNSNLTLLSLQRIENPRGS